MNILSLFDGISCGRLALERAGIQVDKYFASEVDKYAIQIAKKNYPNSIHIGSVTDVRYDGTYLFGTQVPTLAYDMWESKIDMIIGGSPCQDLSIAKKDGKGLQGEKSGLFFEYVRLLKEVKPKYFLLENVASMKKADKEEITRILTEIYPDTQCYLINSALVSAQNRKRLYWTNIQGVEQPKDKGIVLKDILEKNVDSKYNVTINERYGTKGLCIDKSKTLCASMHKGYGNDTVTLVYKEIEAKDLGTFDSYSHFNCAECKKKILKTSDGRFSQCNHYPIRVGQFNSGGQGDRIYSPEGKSVSLSANGGGREAKTGLYEVGGVALRNRGEGKKPEFNGIEKANSMTTVQTDSMVSIPPIIRKLTPIECERLQTLPDNYTEGISNTQRYKAIGNGWTVDVIKHIFSYLK